MAGTPVTYDELTEDHKKNYDAIKSQFEADLIGSFERTRSHGVRRKGFSPEGMLDGEVVELAALGLAAPLKDMALQADYNSLAHMVQKLTLYEQRHPELYQDKFIKRPVTLVETAEVEDPEDQEVAVAEWARGQSLCPANG
ncbi:hypothetical protein QYE76_011012 [Lolium multiflorum]|uniref:Uncharacterized protein n=1 Tax=Lolium multiflorum TaxID=4521 RepID=A0AAD8TUK4_LOLMU|nr:hypothetical protein QYE76_011012 [Lolium multiflorum]